MQWVSFGRGAGMYPAARVENHHNILTFSSAVLRMRTHSNLIQSKCECQSSCWVYHQSALSFSTMGCWKPGNAPHSVKCRKCFLVLYISNPHSESQPESRRMAAIQLESQNYWMDPAPAALYPHSSSPSLSVSGSHYSSFLLLQNLNSNSHQTLLRNWK